MAYNTETERLANQLVAATMEAVLAVSQLTSKTFAKGKEAKRWWCRSSRSIWLSWVFQMEWKVQGATGCSEDIVLF